MSRRSQSGAMIFLASLLLVCPSRGQDAAGGAPSTNDAIAKHMEAMEQEIKELRQEVASLKGTENAASAATPAPAQSVVSGNTGAASTVPPPPSLAGLLGPTTLSGFVDVYYGQNFNNPAGQANGLRFFDGATNQFGLNLVEMVVDKTPDPSNSRTGYHLALGFGQAMNVVNGSEPKGGLGFDQYLKEAYFSYLAPVGKGLQVDVGKFVTPFGAEVIETKDNWNYSRGLLFSYAIPYYHFGMRAKYAFNEKYALTGFFTNGWNDVLDNNSAKTYGATFAWTPSKKFSISENFMIGPEQTNINSNWRQLWDTVATISPTKRLTFMANYDYGRGDRMTGVASPVWWTGIAGYLKYALNEKNAVATRYEYFN